MSLQIVELGINACVVTVSKGLLERGCVVGRRGKAPADVPRLPPDPSNTEYDQYADDRQSQPNGPHRSTPPVGARTLFMTAATTADTSLPGPTGPGSETSCGSYFF